MRQREEAVSPSGHTKQTGRDTLEKEGRDRRAREKTWTGNIQEKWACGIHMDDERENMKEFVL